MTDSESAEMRHGAEGATEKGLEMDVKADIAAEAVRIVTGARRSAYGMPERNFERIARLWNAHLANRFHGLPEEVRLGPGDVAALMRLMKEARLAETPDHWDSYVDIAGYCLAGAEAVGVKRPVAETLPEVVHDALTLGGDVPHELVMPKVHVNVQRPTNAAIVQRFVDKALHLIAEKGDEVCTGFHSSGEPRWVTVVDTDGPPGSRLFCENGSSAGTYPDNCILAVRKNPPTGSGHKLNEDTAGLEGGA